MPNRHLLPWALLLLLSLLLAGCPVSLNNDDDDDDASADDDDTTAGDDDDDDEPFRFPCGDDLTCEAPGQYCGIVYPGVEGAEPSYSCGAVPEDCLPDPDCDCVSGPAGAQDCAQDPTTGAITVSWYAP